jgi:hypothetical protein
MELIKNLTQRGITMKKKRLLTMILRIAGSIKRVLTIRMTRKLPKRNIKRTIIKMSLSQKGRFTMTLISIQNNKIRSRSTLKNSNIKNLSTMNQEAMVMVGREMGEEAEGEEEEDKFKKVILVQGKRDITIMMVLTKISPIGTMNHIQQKANLTTKINKMIQTTRDK